MAGVLPGLTPTSPKRGGLPKFWSTGVAKALVGDQPCLLSPWLQGHYDIAKRERDQSNLTVWKTEHTQQLQAYAEKLKVAGWKVDMERFFKLQGQTAELSGKADLIAQQAEKRPLIIDIKSGKPRDSDSAQVMLEMIIIPVVWKAPSMIFEGRVVYPTHEVTIHPDQAQQFRPMLMAMMKRLGATERPDAQPSRDACRYCDISAADCPQRWQDEDATVNTEFF
jgi:hypothetical protein